MPAPQITLSDDRNVGVKIVLVGPPGCGKTSVIADAPAPLLIRDAPRTMRVPVAPRVDSYGQLKDLISWLAYDQHGYRTIMFDSLSGFEPLVWAEACKRADLKSIDAKNSYGAGYTAADAVWRELLDCLNRIVAHGIDIALTAHQETSQFDDAIEGTSYSHIDLKLHKRSRAIVSAWSDAILLVAQDVAVIDAPKAGKPVAIGQKLHARGGDARHFRCDPRPSHTGKTALACPIASTIRPDRVGALSHRSSTRKSLSRRQVDDFGAPRNPA